MGSTRFRNPPALSSVLAALGMLQLRAIGFLNHIDPLVSASNYYIARTKDSGRQDHYVQEPAYHVLPRYRAQAPHDYASFARGRTHCRSEGCH